MQAFIICTLQLLGALCNSLGRNDLKGRCIAHQSGSMDNVNHTPIENPAELRVFFVPAIRPSARRLPDTDSLN